MAEKLVLAAIFVLTVLFLAVLAVLRIPGVPDQRPASRQGLWCGHSEAQWSRTPAP